MPEIPYTPISKARLFILQSLIAGCLSCQGTFMAENGYNVQTTFWEDFSAADIFGLSAIQDTFNRAFEEWKGNCKYLTELVLVLNHKIWQHYKTKPNVAALYDALWRQADQYAVENLKDEELSYYYDVTD